MKKFLAIFLIISAALLVACADGNKYPANAITAKVIDYTVCRDNWMVKITALPDDPDASVSGERQIVKMFNRKGVEIGCAYAQFLDTPRRVTIEITQDYLDRTIKWGLKRQYPISFKFNDRWIVLTGIF